MKDGLKKLKEARRNKSRIRDLSAEERQEMLDYFEHKNPNHFYTLLFDEESDY